MKDSLGKAANNKKETTTQPVAEVGDTIPLGRLSLIFGSTCGIFGEHGIYCILIDDFYWC